MEEVVHTSILDHLPAAQARLKPGPAPPKLAFSTTDVTRKRGSRLKGRLERSESTNLAAIAERQGQLEQRLKLLDGITTTEEQRVIYHKQ